MLNALLPALLLGAASLTGEPASADLSFNAADLETHAGSQAIYARIARTAESVCAEENRNSAMSVTATRLCVADTIERAVEALDAPHLSEIHAGLSIAPDGETRMVLVASND